ncbi:1-aminocyclopropane-1-carboxylate oxidase homolog [Neltuma alba]|uniref:1-aminocyclopropane-1-carboxylate oxidase homolog n=1 Tax=Neltuma alba TaxID=207710 RepID=UPI0010A39560|nr:1-aminocyclopropane-1-carboxylate oxidase homolog [Prosopis alba]
MDSSNAYDRLQEMKAFDKSKSGVKGLVESGITKFPRIFIRPPEEIADDEGLRSERGQTQFKFSVIDLKDMVANGGDRVDDDVVSKVWCAAETVGFFQVVNHRITTKLLEEMLAAAREFHKVPKEVKMEYYGREEKRKASEKKSSNPMRKIKVQKLGVTRNAKGHIDLGIKYVISIMIFFQNFMTQLSGQSFVIKDERLLWDHQ